MTYWAYRVIKGVGVKCSEELYTYADALIPHYAMAKYPGKPVRYDKGLAERCIKYAERIIKWVEEQASKIPS